MAERRRPHSITEQIQSLLTPESLLEQTHFPSPEPIDPAKYSSFSSLVAQRERVRKLQLLPVRKPEDRIRYQRQSQEQMRDEIEGYLEKTDLALHPDPFPSNLPPDIGQHIIWIRDKQTPPEAISEFIADSLDILKKTPDGIILFEKSHKTETKIIRGTFPHRRHIHLLLKK